MTGELGHGVTQVFILLLGGGAAIGRPGRLELADHVVRHALLEIGELFSLHLELMLEFPFALRLRGARCIARLT